jgi:hypothetical protein
MNPSHVISNRPCAADIPSLEHANNQQHKQTLSGFLFRLELELETSRRQRNQRRLRHPTHAEASNIAIRQHTSVTEPHVERICASPKLNELESSCHSCTHNKDVTPKEQTERRGETKPRQRPQHILDRLQKRTSTGPVSPTKEYSTIIKRPTGTMLTPKSPRNGRRRSIKNSSIRTIPLLDSENEPNCHDITASAVADETLVNKPVSRTNSSTTYQGDSSQSSASHFTDLSHNSEKLAFPNYHSISVRTSTITRRISAHDIRNESLLNLDCISNDDIPINLFQTKDADLLPAGGVHGNSLSLLHTSYSSLSIDDTDCLHSTPVKRHRDPVRRNRETSSATLRQQQRQLEETLRHIQESPTPKQEAAHSSGKNPFLRFSRKNWNGSVV